MNPHTIARAVVLCAVGSFAYAQTAPTTTSPAQPSTATQPGGASGIQMGDAAPPVIVRFVSIKPADTLSSRLVGTTVYNNQNESVGEIEDLVIENGKTITGVVVSAGGFLGMGEHYVLIEPSSIVLSQKDGSMKAFINTTKETLKGAPAFNYTKKKS
ncbi:PRC-barrel domain-containing protein [Microvirga sp. M2]|uniref:PRC-barrel domain-containing protein n=1 Tax=Microvirga sp. M2 TaxID=3073270 RepID=UPI0039C3F61F